MIISKKMTTKLDLVKKMGLCPSILNLYVDRYSFKFLLNDILAGIKMFLFLFPVAFALSYFCGASPIQGIISCAIGALISAIFGGSKYQIISISLPVCLVTFEILSKYQYKGLFYTAVFVSLLLILFGFSKISNVIKHLSHAFVSALAVYVIISIMIIQIPFLLGINSIQSSQSLIENFSIFSSSFDNITQSGIISALIFIVPLFFIKLFFKGFAAFPIYLVLCGGFVYLSDIGILPNWIDLRTFGKEMITNGTIDNIRTLTNSGSSQIFLANTLNYAFIISIIIACESSFCTNVSSSITGDTRIQHNIELISDGVSNFASIACGGLFISPNTNLSIKNIELKSKTILSAIIITFLSLIFLLYNYEILNLIPINAVTSILVVYAFCELKNKRIFQYFNIKSSNSYIFWMTLIIAIYFGFTPATIVGFTLSCIIFANRMVKIKDATVHTTKNHDTGAIEFMTNKNGFANSLNIPENILDKIEVVQITNVLFLNIAKVVEEALLARGKFPSILLIYFNNVPYLDTEAFEILKQVVKNAKEEGAIVMITGTNGRLLDILKEKADSEKNKNVYGYIIPNFEEAIKQVVHRMNGN